MRVAVCGMGADEHVGAGILGVKDTPGIEHLLAPLVLGVDDGQVEPAGERSGEKRCVDELARGQPEADVGDAERGFHAELALDEKHRLQDLGDRVLVGCRRGHHAVDDDVLARDAVRRCPLDDLARNLESLACRGGDAALVEGKPDDGAAVMARQGQDGLEAFLRAVDRVDQGLAVIGAHSRLEGGGVVGIDLERDAAHFLDLLHELCEHFGLVELRQAGIDVEQRRPCLHLGQRLVDDVVVFLIEQRVFQVGTPRGVDALADDGKAVAVELHALARARQRGQPAMRALAGLVSCDEPCQPTDMIW